jgi:hypothetical protein
MTALAALRGVTKASALDASFIFNAIAEAGAGLLDSGEESEDALEIAIRLLEAKRYGQVPAPCVQAVDLLVEECGLYPYVDPKSFDYSTQSVLEAHSIQLKDKFYLHAKQMQVLLWLLSGDNVILSAPTSFGKTLLVDAFIARSQPRTVVMILPTIALIDECRRRLASTFAQKYDIITTSTDEFDAKRKAIFVLTQERFLQRKDIAQIDFLFVDEFYKLDPGRDDGRFETLNLALYRGLPRAKQCFMAGPHIKDIKLAERWRGNFRFVRTDYRTVTVNILDRSAAGNRFKTFYDDLKSVGDESSLIFTSTPGSAERLMEELLKAQVKYPTELGEKLGAWIENNYHKEWPVARGSHSGIAIHHGRLPRSLGQLFIRLFDSGELKVLICTSTLIEGVNTSAANVFIYDKQINRTDFDFFSFANIRGRVGRMMRHFVGNAFLYHEPPAVIETNVEVPMLSDGPAKSDYLLVNTDRSDLSGPGQAMQDAVIAKSSVPGPLLREFGSIGFDLLSKLTERARVYLKQDQASIIWNGYPDKEQRVVLAELCLLVAHARQEPTGLHTAKQVQWAWAQLSKIKSLAAFLRWYARTFKEENVPQGIDSAFQFLQACEFSFPRTSATVEGIIKHYRPDANISYGLYISHLENWFRPPWMKQLDESGIPIPLLERLAPRLNSPDTSDVAARRIAKLDLSKIPDLDDVDHFILKHAVVTRR